MNSSCAALAVFFMVSSAERKPTMAMTLIDTDAPVFTVFVFAGMLTS